MMKLKSWFIIYLLLVLPIIRLGGQNIQTVVQTGHYAAVTAVCYSTDGNFIVTGSSDKTIKLWRRSDGKEIRSYAGNDSGINYVEINKQGTLILSVSENGTLIIWDLFSGKLLKRLKPAEDRFTCASFHPDGQLVITGTRKSGISVMDIQTGNKTREFKAIPRDLYSEKEFDYSEARTATFSNDGQFVVAGVADYTAIIWDASTGKELRKFKRTNSTCTSCLTEAQISKDNKYIITAYSDSIKVFNRETGALVKELFGQGGSPERLSISSDNRFVTAIEYGVAEVWELTTGKLLLKAGNYSEKKILSLAISPDGKQIVAGNEKRTADVVDIPAGKNIMTLKGYLNQVDERILTDSYMYWAALVNETKLSPDGRFIAVGRTGNNAKLIDFKTGKVFKTLTAHKSMVISLCFSKDGKYLATGGLDGKAIIWDVEAGTPVRTFTFTDEKEAIFSVDFSADNKMLATAIWGGYVVIWDIKTGDRLRAISPHDGKGCYQVKFTPNGVYFISAGLDQKLKLIEIDTGEEIRTFTGHTDLVNSIDFNTSGDKIITSAWDGTIRVWDFLSGLQITKIRAHQGGVYSAKFDSSGKYIVSGGDDFLVKLWDAKTGALVSGFAGHQGGVGDVNITSDRKYIISGSRDGSIRIWNVEETRELVSMVFLNENDWFIRNPEGYFDASEGAFSSISFVKGTELYSISQFFNEFYRPGLYIEAFGKNSSAFRQNMAQIINKFPPPSVEIVLPEVTSTVDNPMVTFMVKVTNKGGGVKEFKVMQNGKRQEVDYSDLRRMKKEGQYEMKTFDLNLVPGANEISVSAFSDGDIESQPVSVNLVYNGLQRTSDCYLISIGINKYENESLNLTYARMDAQAFSEEINSKGVKLFNKIHSYTLLDKDANKAKILATLDEICKVMKKEDVFVFFYAGHGSMVDNGFYFITSEITGLYQQDKLKDALFVRELQEKFKMLPALKQVVFIDACQSGSSVDILAMRGGAEEKALAQLSRSSGIHVMASSESQQQSTEIKSLGHGVFTYVLLEALNGQADGTPMDSKITVYEIKSFLDDQVPEMSYKLIRHKQFPSTFSIGHDFPLVMD
ncbi:MAG: caspase family protein [Bacteroidia bacterium]|nr:caspase family protein [Bacteroidia bacterium]